MMKIVAEFNPSKNKVVVTCGPGYEPVDEVRRLTNHSTGRLGTELARALVEAGLNVVCLRGTLSSWNREVPGAELRSFATSADLRGELDRLACGGGVGAIFHAAALSDFRVKEIRDEQGKALAGRKISSRLGELQVILEAAPKLIFSLRSSFPGAWLVGWKYELEGNREQVLKAGLRQIEENRTDACVLNGAAYGQGFGICEKMGSMQHWEDEAGLFAHLIARLHGGRG